MSVSVLCFRLCSANFLDRNAESAGMRFLLCTAFLAAIESSFILVSKPATCFDRFAIKVLRDAIVRSS